MFDNKTMNDSDSGVSPVIGVILMVAITVILAAVIGTFVLDLAGNLQQNASASVTFDENTTDNTVTVQAVSMQNADFVEVRANADSGVGDGSSDLAFSGGSSDQGGANSGDAVVDLASVGTSATLDYNSSSTSGPTSGTITVVGYLEGQGSVLQTYDYGG